MNLLNIRNDQQQTLYQMQVEAYMKTHPAVTTTPKS